MKGFVNLFLTKKIERLLGEKAGLEIIDKDEES
jgi:hypothetical protein